jgi:dihydroneopterin aldolase/D-erythro-7,8-dihydroneopterin triphosphate epimerase
MVRCIIGVDPEERRGKQDIVINIALSADARKAGETDDLQDAVDYRSIKKKVYAMAEASQYNLVESLAERIAEICLAHDGVAQAVVTVEKPAALRFARSVAVEVTRSN